MDRSRGWRAFHASVLSAFPHAFSEKAPLTNEKLASRTDANRGLCRLLLWLASACQA